MRPVIEAAGGRFRGPAFGRRAGGIAFAALLIVGLGPGRRPACAQDPAIVETHRIRLTNQANGNIEVSLDAGRSWETIGHVTRPAAVSAVGGRALEAAFPSSVAGCAPDSVTLRVPTTL